MTAPFVMLNEVHFPFCHAEQSTFPSCHAERSEASIEWIPRSGSE